MRLCVLSSRTFEIVDLKKMSASCNFSAAVLHYVPSSAVRENGGENGLSPGKLGTLSLMDRSQFSDLIIEEANELIFCSFTLTSIFMQAVVGILD